MKLNGIQVVERHSRPGTLSRNVLRLNTFNNGVPFDVYEISSVSLFFKSENVSPSSILDSETQLISDSANEKLKFRWTQDEIDNEIRLESEYTIAAEDQSYIYKTGVGEYAVVLDGTQVTTSVDISGNTIENEASAVGSYIDVWTLKVSDKADWQVFINDIRLFQDSILTTTEPLLLKSKTSLTPNKVRLGEIIEFKVPTEITVMNRNIDQSIKNSLSTGIITNPQFRILKHNEDVNLPSRVEVLGYADTEGLIENTSDNTMVFRFDTSVLTNGSILDLGNGTGTYSVEAKYTLLNETIISPMMYFTVR